MKTTAQLGGGDVFLEGFFPSRISPPYPPSLRVLRILNLAVDTVSNRMEEVSSAFCEVNAVWYNHGGARRHVRGENAVMPFDPFDPRWKAGADFALGSGNGQQWKSIGHTLKLSGRSGK